MTLFKLTKKQIIRRIVFLVILLIIGIFLLAKKCNPKWKPLEVTLQIDEAAENSYIDAAGMSQETRIRTPEGYTRVPAAEGSFLAFMRSQPLYENGSHIYLTNGKDFSGVGAAAVYSMPIGKEGYQQCADTIIRFYSEYYYSTHQLDKIKFHFSNGFLCDFDSWQKGMRVLAFGDYAQWLPLARSNSSEQNFHNYLLEVMRYAGTLSLTDESATISAKDAHAGDIICHGGTPGHAVLLADEAVNENGERCFLIAQGFMPAQSAHIISGFGGTESPWYTEQQLAADTICLSSYTFHKDDLRRWNDGFYQ